MSSPCFRSHAMASWDTVQPLFSARASNWLTILTFWSRLASRKRGITRGRISWLSLAASPLLKLDVNMPRPKGEDTTTATPSSRHVARRLVPTGPSISRENAEYSDWIAATGAILHARRSVVEETADSPICLILPSLECSRQQIL